MTTSYRHDNTNSPLLNAARGTSSDYTIDQVRDVAKHPNVTCSHKVADPGQLNYLSFSVLFGSKRVVITAVEVTVRLAKITFTNVRDKRRYTVTFVSKKGLRLVRISVALSGAMLNMKFGARLCMYGPKSMFKAASGFASALHRQQHCQWAK
ncbi:hypothetical protein NL676_035937 [Syzygium grande]|nr:hypothetical protein NL676_035937 [Syzygium grande]